MSPIARFLPRRHLTASTGIRDQLVQSADVGPNTANDDILISAIAREHSLKLTTLQKTLRQWQLWC